MTQTTQIIKKLAPVAVAMAFVAAAGCSPDVTPGQKGRPADRFLGYGELSPVDRLVNDQIAAGARTDGTLRPYHFDGSDLNSLGREKLDSILAGTFDSNAEMVVYVDVPRGEGDAAAALADARRDAVSQYLVEQGVTEDEFRLESGFNPEVTTSVAAAKPKEGDSTAGDKAFGEGFGKGLGDAMSKQKK
jgi:hypothetical protein